MKIEFGRVNIIGDIKENARIILTIILGTKWLALAVIIVTLIICVTILLKWFANPRKPDYFVTEGSGVVHNRTCTRYYGKTKGFYIDIPGGYRNCKYCGGSTYKKKVQNAILKTRRWHRQ